MFADCYRSDSGQQAARATVAAVQDTNPHYRFYNDWGCGYSGEFVFDNPEFTQLRFKAMIEPYVGLDGQERPGAMRVAYELEARRRHRLRSARPRHPLQTGVTR